MQKAVILILISFFLGVAGAWVMSRIANRIGTIDMPNIRSSHNLPTPRGGGIGILASFAVSSLVLHFPLNFWLPAGMLSLVSFFDDRISLSPKIRLVVQFGAALVIVVPLMPALPQPFSTSLILILLLSVFIVGTANFYNFMDGINGIAGITGVVGFALLGAFAWRNNFGSHYVVFAACMSAACLGFLPLNMPKARVFMGDVGSILIGFTFAAFCCTISRSLTDFAITTGFLFPFYADSLTTLFVRWRDGERLSQGHRRHLYQLFANQRNIAHWKVSCWYGLIQASFGCMLLLIGPSGLAPVIIAELIMLAGWYVAMGLVRRQLEANAY
jgi:Fuc2NAc and GlcNAc transferase